MVVCDICNKPGIGTIISSEDMRKAVFKKNFNPWNHGLLPSFGLPVNEQFENWKNSIVAQDTSDWNICERCMSILTPYLEGSPKATGIKESTVSFNPQVGRIAAKDVEEKYKKKRWQFWK
jgi:hypothetical protein